MPCPGSLISTFLEHRWGVHSWPYALNTGGWSIPLTQVGGTFLAVSLTVVEGSGVDFPFRAFVRAGCSHTSFISAPTHRSFLLPYIVPTCFYTSFIPGPTHRRTPNAGGWYILGRELDGGRGVECRLPPRVGQGNRGRPGSAECHEESEARMVKVNLLTLSAPPRRLK